MLERRVTLAFLGAGLGGLLGLPARAQPAYPTAPIRIITPTPVGVGSDVFARLYGDHLGKLLKTPVFVDNRPGASGMLGTDAVAKSAANGYTLLFTTSLPFTTAPFLFAKVPYDAQRDLVPVIQLYRGGSFVLAGNAFAGKSIADLVAFAKREPNRITYASYGPGSTAHLGMELLQDAAGIQLIHVPYKQSAMTDLVGGQVAIGFEPPISALPQVKAGKVRALAYTGSQRSAALPDVPTLAESYPGLEIFTWVGVWAPAGTPEPVRRQLQAAFLAVGQDAEVQKSLADAGLESMRTSEAQMTSVIVRESEAMSRLIKAKNITVN
jgi:tripartite-type tricarboxylate transporter receptor subunit TctC